MCFTADGPNFSDFNPMSVNASIFTVEALGIVLVFIHIKYNNAKFIFFTDSLSVVRSISPKGLEKVTLSIWYLRFLCQRMPEI